MTRFALTNPTEPCPIRAALLWRCLWIAWIALSASACVSSGGAVATEVALTVVAATEAAVTQAPLTATEIPPEPATPAPAVSATIPLPTPTKTPSATPVQLGGGDISFNGIGFSVDPALGEAVSARVAADVPGYTQFSFTPGGRCQDGGCVTVYRVDAFKTYPFGSDIVEKLQAAIASGSDEYFPTRASAILLRAQTQHIRFQNGAGIRAIVMRGQNGYLANNEAVVYDFHALTDDGQYYVEVAFPVDASILLSTYDPAENTNPAAFLVPEIPEGPPFGETLKGVMLEYNQAAQRQLDLLDSAGFIPDLGLLDALVASLRIAPPPGE